MTYWTPSRIAQQAATIADLAKQVDGQLWWATQYDVVNVEAYNADLQRKSRELQLAIAEFKNIDLDAAWTELRGKLK